MTDTGNLARARQYAPVLSDGGSRPNATSNTTTRDTAAAQDRCSSLNSTCDNKAHKVIDGV